MPGHGRPLFMTLAICLLIRASAFAADTGSVSGTVFDQAGKPIADVLVKISGDRLPVGRSSQTDANGAFRFEYLLPGTYTDTRKRAEAALRARDTFKFTCEKVG